MTTHDRRSARNQPLPPEEVELLLSLRGYSLYVRAHELFKAGWTLRAIGEAYTPPKARSTVKSWVDRGINSNPTTPLPIVSAPTLRTTAEYQPKRPISPGISPADVATIKTLAPISRRFRSGMPPAHGAATANQALTDLCTTLHASGVSIGELASAAGVSYRAMAKRLGRS